MLITSSIAPPAIMSKRSALLDCIRAVAILMVFGFHVATRYDTEALEPFAAILQRIGFLGVDLFFPLSGFLITRFLLLSNYSNFVRIFFLRRIFRILPLYFLALFSFFCASKIFGVGADVIDRIWVNILFLTGWFVFVDGKETVPYLVTWSLSVEEFGYIILGLMAWISRERLPVFLIFMLVLAVVVRFAFSISEPSVEMSKALYYLPIARLDSIASGGLIAVLINIGVNRIFTWCLMVFIGLIVAMNVDIFWARLLLSLTVAVGTCLLIILAEKFSYVSDFLPLRFFASIGFYSYFNYLFQFFVIDFFLLVVEKVGVEKPTFWVTFLICLLITHLLAALSFRVFEGPLMRFGRKLET